jgi:hypothetical protein
MVAGEGSIPCKKRGIAEKRRCRDMAAALPQYAFCYFIFSQKRNPPAVAK